MTTSNGKNPGTRIAVWLFLCCFTFIQFRSLRPSVGTHSIFQSVFQQISPDSHRSTKPSDTYVPALVEDFVLEHSMALGFESVANPSGCAIWTNQSVSTHYKELQLYLKELQTYSDWVKNFPPIQDDIREHLRQAQANGVSQEQICSKLQPFPNNGGVEQFFGGSGQVSHTHHGGFVEPLLPPMRHPQLCFDFRKSLMNMEYMVHDFSHLCQQLTPTSRIVFLDMGAS
jgi:hypothetical protein